jgi:ubiquinone/menaquinone biosynthesis C-methylase UbiE
METHGQQILDQFTKQASLFQASHSSAEQAIAAAVSVSGVGSADTVLDVACGPGILSCAFARVARNVIGIDITPSMLQEAQRLQMSSGVSNVTWKACDVYHMPFGDASFSLVITRYAFHHFEHPSRVLSEMVRVCEPGGRVVVIDSAPPPEKAQAFNAIEKRRDPSHTKALTREELTVLMCAEGLSIEKRHLYAWEVTAESLLARSFPADDDRDSIFQAYAADVGRDELAMNTRFIQGALHVTFPTLITVARKVARGGSI